MRYPAGRVGDDAHPAGARLRRMKMPAEVAGEEVGMRALPETQWRVAIEGEALLLSAWSNPNGIRHWVKFTPSNPVNDRACLDDLKGLIVHVDHAHAV